MSPTTPNNQPGAAGAPVAPQPPIAGRPPVAPQPAPAPAAPVRPAPQPVIANPQPQPAPAPAAPAAPAPAPQPAAPAPQPAQPAQPAPVAAPVAGPAPKKRGHGKLIGIIIAAVVAIAAVGVVLFFIFNKALGDIELYKTDAFFLSTKDGSDTKYALFKKDGEKITDFIFSQAGAFINGYAYVENLSGKEGIIDHTGKMTVDFGEYDSITPRVGIYEVSKNNKQKLILGNGDELASEYLTYSYSSSAPYVAVRFDDNRYELYNALGSKLAEFESVDLPEITTDNPETASAVSYKGGLIILSNKKFKPIKTVETGIIYAIDDATKNGDIITFVEKGKIFESGARRAVYNKDFAEFGEKCDDIDLHDNNTDEGRVYLTCEVENKDKLIRGGAITDFVVSNYDDDGITVYDQDHFAAYSSKNKKATIYVNGEKKTTFDTDYRIYASIKGYIINNYKTKAISLYDLDGNLVYALKDTLSSSELSGVDKNGNIIVRDAKEDSSKRYYIIDKDGKELSGRYYSIVAHGEYYSAYRKDSESADLLDKNGKVIISGKYDEFDYYEDEQYIFGRAGSYSERKYDLIDVKNKSVKASLEGTVYYYEQGYFRLTKDKKVSYYTTDGKLIYSYETE